MNDYVEQLWQNQATLQSKPSRFSKVFGWSAGLLAGIALIAYVSYDKWYPYVQPYLHS
jgi:hypothetical protein